MCAGVAVSAIVARSPGRQGVNRASALRRLGLDDEVDKRRLTDIHCLVPLHSFAVATRARHELDLGRAVGVGDFDTAAGDDVTKVGCVEVTLVANTWWKGAAQNAVAGIFMQFIDASR